MNIRVLDANGEVIAESFAMATCGTGCRGDFSTQIDVPIDAEQPGTIQVFEYSAKDGSMINTVEIPVTLVPDVVRPRVSKAWFDGYECRSRTSPLNRGTMPSSWLHHCQWESAMFMQSTGRSGPATSAGGPNRPRPSGLFDDGALQVGYLSDTSLPSGPSIPATTAGVASLDEPGAADDAVFLVNADTGIVERWGGPRRPSSATDAVH